MARLTLLISVGLAAGTLLGAGPAQATGAAGQTAAAPQAVQVQQPRDDDVVGYYYSRRICERVGRVGEWRDKWESYECDFVRWGPHRGMWRLEVERDWDWDDHHGGPGDDDDDDDHDGHGHHGGGHD